MKENTAGTSILEQLRKAWKIVSRRDVALFVISLFAAYVIWIVHNMSLNYTRMARVLIEARTNIDGHSNLSANTATLQARLRTTGYEWVMMNSRATSGKSQIVDIDPSDLHYASGDTWFITSTELNKYSPYIFSENTVLEIVQDTLFFRFPEQNYRRVPVQAVCSIDFKSQYASVGGVKMIPDSVGVYGEPYLIDNIEKVYTERFELSNLSGTATGECKLVPIKGTRLSHKKVAYVVDVSRYVEMTEDIPILPRNVPSDRSLAIQLHFL